MSAVAQFFGWVLIVGAVALLLDIVGGSMSAGTLALCVLLVGVGAAIIVWARRRDATEAGARCDGLLGKNSWWFLLLLVLPGSVNAVKMLYAHELGRYLLGGLVLILFTVAVRAFRSGRKVETRAEPIHVALQDEETVAKRRDELSRLRGDDPDVIRAAELGKHETVKQLIALGAHLDVEGCGRTDDSALMAAVRSGSKETVEALIAAGADVNRGIAHDDDRDYVWNDDWKTPFKVAALCGNHDILKLLLDRGARPPDLRSPFDSGVEEGILMLFEIGEDGLARNLGRAAAGVELPQPDADRLERARFLGSVFAALAEWFNARGDRLSAKRLCEWKIERWRVEQVQDDWDRLPMEMAACLRTLASVCESEGKTQEALRQCRTALRVWRINDLEDVPPLIAGSVLDDVHFGMQALSDVELRRTLSVVPELGRGEFATALRDCERMLGRFGIAEEQGRVAVALERLGSENP